MGCSIASDFWLSDRISSWISKVLFVTRMSSDRKSTRLNSSHLGISYAVFCLKKKKSVHGVLNPTYQAGLRRDAVQPDIEAERKKRDEIEAGKSYCSRRFGGATCDDKSAQIYARFDKNDWRIQPAEFYRFHDAYFFSCYDVYRDLHSFPTRRSSD